VGQKTISTDFWEGVKADEHESEDLPVFKIGILSPGVGREREDI